MNDKTTVEPEEEQDIAAEVEAADAYTESATYNKPSNSKAGGVWSGIALVFALSAMVGGIYLWLQQTSLQKQLTRINLQPLSTKLQKVADENQTLHTNLETLRQQYLQLLVSFKTLQNQQQLKPRNDVILVEADALLRFAQQRYMLTHDIKTSIEAMKSAELLLRGRSDAALVAIRQQITAEIELLQAVKVTRVTVALASVTQMVMQVDKYPLRSAHPQVFGTDKKADKTTRSVSVWEGLLKTLQPLVTVRRSNHKTRAMLGAEEERHVRLILLSRLELLRLSLLQKNEAAVHSLSEQSRVWLTSYFDGRSAEVSEALNQLEVIGQLRLSVSYPKIGMALNQLQQFRLELNTVKPQP